MTATVVYGVLAVYFFATTQDWRRRVVIVLVASLLILLVGFSRIYLGVQLPERRARAMAEGLAWLALCLDRRCCFLAESKLLQSGKAPTRPVPLPSPRARRSGSETPRYIRLNPTNRISKLATKTITTRRRQSCVVAKK